MIPPSVDSSMDSDGSRPSSSSPLRRVRRLSDSDQMQAQLADRPKKQMRKGTRSCLQCRQRKVACSLQVEPAHACRQCIKRGISCKEQEYEDIHSQKHADSEPSAAHMTDRVDQLEALMKQIVDRLPDTAADDEESASISIDLAKAVEMLASLKTSTLHTSEDILPAISSQAPIMSLFDNAVLSRRDEPTPARSAENSRHRVILTALRAILPEQRLMERLIDASPGGWRFIWWSVFPYNFIECPPGQHQTPLWHLLASDCPAMVAKGIIYFAINICHLPPDFDTTQFGLPGRRTEAMERYVNLVDRLVTSDDLLSASPDGIECIALQIHYFTNLGRTRRAWLLARRAIGIAQQCGLVHFMSPSKARQTMDERRVAKLWGYIMMADMHLSLLLGLSHCTSDQMILSYQEAVDNLPGFSDGERYQARMFPIIKRIIERNQETTLPSISTTLQIDRELDDLARTHPQEWWHLCSADEAGISVEEHFSRRSSQFLHYQVRAVLHMPFMLHPSQDKRHIYSYNATLESSRNIVRTFSYLKAETDLALILSRLYDFFTFTAAVTLLLSLIGYSQHGAPQHAATHLPAAQSQHDSHLVDTATALLKAAAVGPTGRVPAQCTRALELLATARHTPRHAARNTLQISIPYFGRIRLGPGRAFRAPPDGQFARPAAAVAHPHALVADIAPPVPHAAPSMSFAPASGSPGQGSSAGGGAADPASMGLTGMPTPESITAAELGGALAGEHDELLLGLNEMGSFADMDMFGAEGAAAWIGTGVGPWALDPEQPMGWGGIDPSF